jgi:hypothetical protein
MQILFQVGEGWSGFLESSPAGHHNTEDSIRASVGPTKPLSITDPLSNNLDTEHHQGYHRNKSHQINLVMPICNMQKIWNQYAHGQYCWLYLIVCNLKIWDVST